MSDVLLDVLPMTSPPTNTRSPQPSSPTNGTATNAQLANLLSESCKEAETLRRDLLVAKRRAEKAERLVATFNAASAGNPQGQPIPDSAARAILECENRVERAEQARDDAEARRRVLMDTWSQLDKYLGIIELRAADARAGYSRIVSEGGGQLVLSTIPLPGQQSHTSLHSSFTMPPPPHASRHHIPGTVPSRHSSLQRSHTQAFPTSLPLPPPPNVHPNSQNRVRQRAESVDANYLGGIPGQPPSKRSRSDRDRDSDIERGRRTREDRAMYVDSPANSPHLQNVSQHRPSPQSTTSTTTFSPQSQHPMQEHHFQPHGMPQDLDERSDYLRHRIRIPHVSTGTGQSSHPSGEKYARRRRSGSGSHSRASSRSSASSLSVDEMLLQATTGGADERPGTNGNGSGSGQTPPPGIGIRTHGNTSHPHQQQHRQSHHHHHHRQHSQDLQPHPHYQQQLQHQQPYPHPRLRPESPLSDYRSQTAQHTHSSRRSHAQSQQSQSQLAQPSQLSQSQSQSQSQMGGPGMMSGPRMPMSLSPDAPNAGPLQQPGQVQTYQTHVFAPVVTGAPVKKSKFAAGGTPNAPAAAPGGAGQPSGNGNVIQLGPNGNAEVSVPVVPPASFPATNAQGQRICRQCGLPGRYKDNKCVEKWGPGPQGPGTVCDRCRKKMKRVERRGTTDSQHMSQSALSMSSVPVHMSTHQAASQPRNTPVHSARSDRSVHRSDTLPVTQTTSGHTGQLGPAGTHLLGPHGSISSPRPHGRSGTPSSKSARGAPRSPPPAIAILPGTGEDTSDVADAGGAGAPVAHVVARSSASGARAQSRPSSSNGTASGAGNGNGNARRGAAHRTHTGTPPVAAEPSVSKRSPLGSGSDRSGSKLGSPAHATAAAGAAAPHKGDGETDADADAEADPDVEIDPEAQVAEVDAEAEVDADAEAEGDADADAELLEAVDAAEANTSTGPAAEWLKEEEDI